jgi:hypothetical protein
MEKTISIRNTEITFSIWDLGGQREFVNMLPLVCNDAVAILFMFDLTRKSTLNSIKEWYRQGRGFNKTAIPFLVGTKYDHFVNFPREEQEEISNQAGNAHTQEPPPKLTLPGKTLRKGDEGQSHLQQHQPQHQRAEGNMSDLWFPSLQLLTLPSDLQDRPLQGIRPQVHHPRDRKHWRAAPTLPSRLIASSPDLRASDGPNKGRPSVPLRCYQRRMAFTTCV